MNINNKKIKQILNIDGITDIKITDANTVKIKMADKSIKRVTSDVFSGKDEYLEFIDSILLDVDYIKNFPAVKFTEKYDPEYNIKTSVFWVAGDQPVLHMKKLKSAYIYN